MSSLEFRDAPEYRTDLQRRNPMSEHTPGPWRVHANGRDVVNSNDRLIAHTNLQYASFEADARLIAAAPALLAALKEIRDSNMYHSDFAGAHEFEKARAAIARAEGRES